MSLTYELVNDPGDKSKPYLDGSSLCCFCSVQGYLCRWLQMTYLTATWLQEIQGNDRKAHAAQLHSFSFSQDIFSFQSHTALEALNHTAFRTYYLKEKLYENICFQQSCFISAVTSFKFCVLAFSLQMWQWHSIFQSRVFYLCSFAVSSRDCYLV